jgi:hypothetical protein
MARLISCFEEAPVACLRLRRPRKQGDTVFGAKKLAQFFTRAVPVDQKNQTGSQEREIRAEIGFIFRFKAAGSLMLDRMKSRRS